METLDNVENSLEGMTKRFKELAGPGSKTAVGILLARLAESIKPDSERICYDPYAVRFISPEILRWLARHPEEVKAMHEQREHFLPGLNNSIVARVRFFDDFVERSISDGTSQLVILGAGYDSRAYRMETLHKVRTFEVDHPATQTLKMEKMREIFGSLPDHVAYVPADLGREDIGQCLLEKGYDQSLKTLFLMEGVLMYLRPTSVDGIFSFIATNSAKGSRVLFDYHPKHVIDGSSEIEAGRNLWNHVLQLEEPFLFGIEEEGVERFLGDRGFSEVQNVTPEDYKRAYFHGKNEGRAVFSLLSFAHAMV